MDRAPARSSRASPCSWNRWTSASPAPAPTSPRCAPSPPRAPLQPGSRLDHPTYDRLRNDLLRVARDIGFLDAELTRRELVVNPPARAAAAYLELETGGRYRFGAVSVEQDVIDDALLQRFVRFETGQVFSTARMRNTQFALQDSNYFSTVTVTPGERDPETLTVPVTIRADAIKRHRYSVSVGYGTDTEIRGRFAWDNRRVNDRGHRLRFEATGSAVLTEIIARYIIPVGDPALEKLEFSAAHIDEELGDLDSRRTELTGGLTQAMGQWQRVLFLMLNQERTSFADGSSRDDLLLIPGISYASMPPNFLTGWVRDAAYYFELTRQPRDARLGRVLPALLHARRAGLAGLGPLVRAAARRVRHELDQRLLGAAGLAALLRRRRPQRARLRARRVEPDRGDRLGHRRRRRASRSAASTRSSAPSSSSATCRTTCAAPCSWTPATPSATGTRRSSTRWASGCAGGCR